MVSLLPSHTSNPNKPETELEFNGIRQRLALNNLTADALTTIPAGESLVDEFDIASTLDITDSGPIIIHTSGFVPITTDSEITSHLPYTSNTLTIIIDAAKAATVPKALSISPPLHRRTRLSDCDNNQAGIMRAAFDNAMRMSVTAANEAWIGSAARLEEYFKSSSQETRSLVANRLAYIAAEASPMPREQPITATTNSSSVVLKFWRIRFPSGMWW